MENALASELLNTRDIREKVLRMIRAKSNGGGIRVRYSGDTVEISEAEERHAPPAAPVAPPPEPADRFDGQRERMRLRVSLAQRL